MSAPVLIRKPEVAGRLRELARLEGKSITELVEEMVRERDERLVARRDAEVQARLAAVEDIVSHFNSLPIVGPLLSDDDLYDENGLPK